MRRLRPRVRNAVAEVPALPRLPGELRVERLPGGLTVALLASPQAPLVSTALWYRAGTRDEPAGHGGIAHFLEHMMFKGSARFGPGEVDRRTQALGGANNAFTSHDATCYWFQLSADRWPAALEMEADRMAGLALDPKEMESERRVILEEIAMYEDDPWDALSQRVEAALYGPHPYGRPVLGTREELLATGPDELRAFHRSFYAPGNAVLVVAGDFGEPERAFAAVAEAFGPVMEEAAGPPARQPTRERIAPRPSRTGLIRVERRKGEVGRLLLSLPIPPADDPDLPALRIAAGILGVGRSSRLYRDLVDEAQLCAWTSTALVEAIDPGALSLSAELVSGTEPARVEEAVLRHLGELAATAPSPAEVERAREVLFADWTFAHERISQQALTAGSDLILFRAGWSEEEVRSLAGVGPEDVRRAVERGLDPDGGGVLGWSLPENGGAG